MRICGTGVTQQASRWIIRALRYIHKIGVIRGPLILFKISAMHRVVQLSLPGYQAPLFLRTGTSDVPTFEQVFIYHEYELPFLHLHPQLIIDGGANVGYTALFFARKYPNARILAIEPELSNFELLVRNTRPYHNIIAIRSALWNKSTLLEIENPQDEKWLFRVRETNSMTTHAVDAITLPDLLAMSGSDRVDILKLDIEGAEKELFESNYEMWLDKVRTIIIELHDSSRAGCSTSFYRATTRYNFKQRQRGGNIILEKYEG